MKHRTKIFVSVFLTVVLINCLTLAIVYFAANRYLFQEAGNNALSIAATTAAFVDGEEHKAIQTPMDENKDEYRRIRDVLTRARDANRKVHTNVRFLYTFKPLLAEPTALAYGVDCEESPTMKSPIDEPLKNEGRQMVLDQPGVDADFSKDEYGEVLTANVPVRDRSGQIVAGVGVDLPATFVNAKLNRLRRAGLYSLGVAIALAALAGLGLSMWISKPVRSLYQKVKAVEGGDFDGKADILRKDEFGSMAGAVNSLCDCLRQKDALVRALTPYVSTRELNEILTTGMPPTVKAERRHITVLFSDIREFTKMSEKMRPEEVSNLLNEYFEKMIEVVLRHHGVIDKFIGDGLMALFGASDDDSFQEENAVYAALEMQAELLKLSEKWSKEGRRPLRIGVGINSGNAIVGNLGSAKRLEYTAIGDTVNLASRLESATKDHQADILISEYTRNGLQGAPFELTSKGTISIRGRTSSVTVYAVAAMN